MASTLRFRTGPTKQDTCMLESKRQIRVETSTWQVAGYEYIAETSALLVERMAGTRSW